MGGNALKCGSERMDIDRYNVIKNEILDLLNPYYRYCVVPKEKPGKTSYGDLDVICCMDFVNHPNGCMPTVNFGSKESVRNGHVLSFEFKNHQIDIIHVTTEKEFLFSHFFYSYGDMGMIIGMILHTCGLMLSDRALSMNLPDYKYTLKLADDIEKIFEFMGWNYDTHCNSQLEFEKQVFSFIESMKYFRHSMFRRDELNCKRRKRYGDRVVSLCETTSRDFQRKSFRPMFAAFVTHCNNHKDETEERIDSSVVREEALDFFHKRDEYEVIKKKHERAQVIKAKFNGNLIKQWVLDSNGVTLEGADLGTFIKSFKQTFTDDEIYAMDAPNVEETVLIHYKKLSGCLNN